MKITDLINLSESFSNVDEEVLTELELNNPVQYKPTETERYVAFTTKLPRKVKPKQPQDDEEQRFAASVKTPNFDILSVFFGFSSYRGVKGDTMEISFSVNDKIDMTGVGNPIEIFGAVSYIIKQELPKFLKRNPEITNVIMAADLKEKTRVSFYSKRIAPRLSEVLGSDWIPNHDVKGKYMRYSWTKVGYEQPTAKSKKEKRAWSIK